MYKKLYINKSIMETTPFFIATESVFMQLCKQCVQMTMLFTHYFAYKNSEMKMNTEPI